VYVTPSVNQGCLSPIKYPIDLSPISTSNLKLDCTHALLKHFLPLPQNQMRKMSNITIATLPRISSSTLSSMLLAGQSSNVDTSTPPPFLAIVDVRDDGTLALS